MLAASCRLELINGYTYIHTYRRMLKISWKEKVSDIEVLKRVDTKLHFGIDMWKRKLSFAGHVLRGSGGDNQQLVLEGKINGKRWKGRLRLIWMNKCGK